MVANFFKDAIKNGTINIFTEHKHEILFMLKIYAKEFFLLLIFKRRTNFPDSNSKANVYKKFGEGDKKDQKKIIKM